MKKMSGVSSRMAGIGRKSVAAVIGSAAVAFLAIPAVMVVVLSFSADKRLVFPPQSYGLTQYRAFFGTGYWVSALGQSFLVAVISGVAAVVIGVMASVALFRLKLLGGKIVYVIGLSPLVLPSVAYAIALYTSFIIYGVVATTAAVVCAHVVLGLPFVLLIFGTALKRLPRGHEMAAIGLGASPARAFFSVTLPRLKASMVAAFIFAFIVSFDDAVYVLFLGGSDLNTLPKAIFNSVRDGTNPVVTAISATLVVVSASLLALGTLLRSRGSEGE